MNEWKKKRGFINRLGEKIEDLPVNAIARGRPITDSAKRKLYDNGSIGKATILKPPPKSVVSEVQESEWWFTVSVELPGREPYETKIWQRFGKWEWDAMQEGAVVECRVDPGNPELLLLVAPEPGQTRVLDSAGILAAGKRASATVQASKPYGMNAPGTDDPIYVLDLELRSDHEPHPWRVQIGQRVPQGSEAKVMPGSELSAAYLEVDGGDSVAIDWPPSGS